ncbi:hypothetical protein LNN38_21170 [Pseudomonas sp. LA21]|uniref:hypothetical protein n=1 Tax=Pseudomonas sp. LA21 TaxID=2893373 RepID=UPI001FB573C5|nr:hypothetical protein [Pseudomonas sp. LA21]MCJ1887386.1 hypothetical protein [Pseudomonas sp. LA21]
MRIQVSYHDRHGDEKWHYLEFDEDAGYFVIVKETCSRSGEWAEFRYPLHESSRDSGYYKAIAWIKDNLMKQTTGTP